MKFCFFILAILLCFAGIPHAYASDEIEALKRLELKADEATPDKIKAAHRAAVKRFHPDANGPEASAEKFNSIQEAYDFLTGKIPKLPGSSGGRAGAQGYTNDGGGFRDFHNPFAGADKPKWKPSGEVPVTDPFVRRFGIEMEAEGRFGEKASFTYAMKERFETFVNFFEKLARSGKGEEAVAQFIAVDMLLPKVESKIFRDVIFTLIGEHSRHSKKEADTLLKALVNGLGMEQMPGLFSIKRELRLTRQEYGKWPDMYPETTKTILTSPGFARLDGETRRRLVLTLMHEDDLKKYPKFYEDLANSSSSVRGELEKKRIKVMFGRNPPMPEGEFQAQLKLLVGNLQIMDSGGDSARFKLLDELMGTKRDITKLGVLVEEVKKVKDFSSFSLMRALNIVFLRGSPEEVAVRRDMIGTVLQNMMRDAPEAVVREKAAMNDFFRRMGSKEWEEVIAFVDGIISPAPVAATAAEYKIFARQCSTLYAKTANLLK